MLSRARAGSFAANAWLRADGDGADQASAQARSGAEPQAMVIHLRGQGLDVVHLSGRRALAKLDALCLPGRLVVTSENAPPAQRHCHLITPDDMRHTGALAIAADGRKTTAAMRAGERPWTMQRR